MREAMSQFASWYEKGFRPGTLALNLAMKQLQQKDFIAILKNILDETNCKSHWLEFEVTETEIMTNPEQAISALEEMSKLGIEIAVDDFGTGYSSLSYLKKLPINKLKIDQSFVRNLHTNKEDASITKTIINLAKNLDLKVLAEGVETFEQKEFLSQNRCKYIQGFLYSKPIMAKDMEDKFL
jgi:EAL domain-containing protein (putative c-di-GMP-specific phosphodiesterase class I)